MSGRTGNYRSRELGIERSSPRYTKAYRNTRRANGECFDCTRPAMPNRARCESCLQDYAAKEALRRKADKKACFDHYGRTCVCCKIEFEEIFLTLDHVNNDGAEHRRSLNSGGGRRMYQWARRNSFPAILQTMCWNCNLAKQFNGGTCPHQVAKQDSRVPTGVPNLCN